MGASGGPNIPKDKLSLAVHAVAGKSFPGSGDDWFDLAEHKITFSANGTQTPFTTVDGVDCFDFNQSGYWQSDSGHTNVDFGGDCTLALWYYPENTTTRRTIFEKIGASGNTSYQTEIAVTLETSENFSWYSRKTPNYDHASTAGMTQGQWELMSIKMSTGKTSAARTGFYSLNGDPYVANYNSRSDTAVQTAGAIRIGHGYAGTVGEGYLAAVYCYNKMLSDEEIKQLWNATKNKYGR